MTLKRSPLLEEHQRLSAKLVEFAGWEMPISYPTGTLSEHGECRSGCVMFDVSHLGSVLIEGEGAFEELQYAFTNDLSKISPGRAQYSHLLNQKGYVVDDVIIWWLEKQKFEVMPNASNTHRVEEAMVRRGKKLTINNITENRAVIAVQGPTSRKILSSLSVEAASVKKFHVEEIDIDGIAATVAGTGYTGEDGVEISIPKNSASILWTALLEAGCTPAGLGARDTLRLEAGLPLHGQELGEGISPIQANMQWVVSMSKGTFFGKEALQEELENGPSRSLRGFISESRRPLRQGQDILLNGDVIGQVTSGNYSPTLGSGIAMGFISPGIEDGTQVRIRGKRNDSEAKVVKLPFYRSA
jgi:aminomethyltransferase